MVEIERTADPVRLSFLKSVLEAAAIQSFIFEPNVGALWPGTIAPRLMVNAADERAARQAIGAADPKEVWR